MGVIINDFEVEIECPPEVEGGEAVPGKALTPPSLTPKDIRDILRRQAERMERVQAY